MNEHGRVFLYFIYKAILHIFALIGFVFVTVFFAVRLHWTDVPGSIDVNSDRFSHVVFNGDRQDQNKILRRGDGEFSTDTASLVHLDYQIKQLSEKKALKTKNYCIIDIIGQHYPGVASKIIQTYQQTDADVLIARMALAARIRIEEKKGNSVFSDCDDGNITLDDNAVNKKYLGFDGETVFPWMNNQEWSVIREAIIKDRDVIEKAALAAKIEQRLLISCTIVEQVRLFNSQRELFKKFFEPLKILGNANKISLGVMGIKEDTAIKIENHLEDLNSVFYLGNDMQYLLDFESAGDSNKQRYDRLTEDTHYYSYLYGAIYLKQIMTQWEKAGFDIKYRPEIVGTLFNVGFSQSKPNPNPKVGGSTIEVDGVRYTFGSLAYEFYYSGELLDVFPYIVD